MSWPLDEGILRSKEGSCEEKTGGGGPGRVCEAGVGSKKQGPNWKFGSVQDTVGISRRERCLCTPGAIHRLPGLLPGIHLTFPHNEKLEGKTARLLCKALKKRSDCWSLNNQDYHNLAQRVIITCKQCFRFRADGAKSQRQVSICLRRDLCSESKAGKGVKYMATGD